ncbi:MICAL-like protein 1 isoform X2 [Cimex lectularius]|uniref:MICAL-like protein 1 n=1 Tax=Cimex lectularius TaxID=79782 RepID=A0A8I6RDB8_CIMLE|nr:MICAL-like protein 1 isoform X2 [Cimex lectularius]
MGERRGTKALEMWCKRVTQGYPGVKVENMTTSWRDGMAFCAMIHHFRPDLIDFSSLDKSDILKNNEMAFRIAERHLGIPALLDAEDMAEYPVPDRLSILTYLSQFYQAFASNNASPIKKQSSESPDTSLTSLTQSNVQHAPKMEGTPPWKEPCVICDHAVFLAQRLRVEGKLYHRTCFRCARCNAQLSTADYYETHDGQYCCETCPDEDMEHSAEPPIVIPSIREEEQIEQVINLTRPQSIEPTPSQKSSLVAMRKMLFDSYNKDTDDAKLNRCENKTTDDVNSIEDSKNDLSNNDDSSSQNQFRKNSEESVHTNVDCKNEDSPLCVELNHTDSKVNDRNSLDNNVNILVDKVICSDVEIDSDKVVTESDDKVDLKETLEDKPTSLGDNKSLTVHTDDLKIKSDDTETQENHKIIEAINVSINVEENVSSFTSKSPTVEIVKEPAEDKLRGKESDYPSGFNPFGDDEDEEEKSVENSKTSTNPFDSDTEDEEIKSKSPEKLAEAISPIHKASSQNPFGSDEEDDTQIPVPLPRRNTHSSPVPFPRTKWRGSQRSLCSMSSMGSHTSPRKKRPAPPPPVSPSISLTSPRSRKTKRAPLPPSLGSSRLSLSTEVSSKASEDSQSILSSDQNSVKGIQDDEITTEISNIAEKISAMADAQNKENEESKRKSTDEPLESGDMKCTLDESVTSEVEENTAFDSKKIIIPQTPPPKPRRLEISSNEVTLSSISPTPSASTSNVDSLTYQEDINSPTEKQSKDFANLHQKISEERGATFTTPNKSTHGQWRRKKAPAPPLPLPKRRTVKPMPIQNIKQELKDIEIKQQGLERQGVALENKIRDKFDTEESISPYVEELVLQLFELVNEKNELFRKQAELMYLRRQHNLEEEHAELEYQIRCLMARPEVNKTDSDKETEEQLIQRLVEVVERRDAIVQCLEMDRLREAEEDKSISLSLDIGQEVQSKPIKKQKKKKDKRNSLKTLDLDKDLDESEKEIKKKKKWYTLHHLKNKHL